MGLFSLTQELAIDLGTANTLIIHNGRVVVDEPSIVAIDSHSGKLVAIGERARAMHEKTNPNIKTIRPLKDGVIADFTATELMLRGMIKKVKSSGHLFSPSIKMVICIPSGSTNVEIRAVRDSAEHAGGREVYMINEPIAAAQGEEEEGFKLSDIKFVVTNKGFWLIALLCLMFYAGVFPFLKFAAQLMIYKYGVDPVMAGDIPAILPFGTILLTPLFGSLYDRIGKGATLMVVGAMMLVAVHVLFALPILNEWWFALIVMVLLGIAFSLVPSAMWPSVPKIIPQKQLGTAYALIFYVQNIGLMCVPMLIGWVIDRYAKFTLPDGNVSYDFTAPMWIFALFGIVAVALAFMLKAEDRRKGYGLEEANIRK